MTGILIHSSGHVILLFEPTKTVPTKERAVRHVIGIGWNIIGIGLHAVATAAIIAIHRANTGTREAIGGRKVGCPLFLLREHFRAGYHQE
jgi:hypothetical protein